MFESHYLESIFDFQHKALKVKRTLSDSELLLRVKILLRHGSSSLMAAVVCLKLVVARRVVLAAMIGFEGQRVDVLSGYSRAAR
jgi:hypothetical protein